MRPEDVLELLLELIEDSAVTINGQRLVDANKMIENINKELLVYEAIRQKL